MKPRSYRGWWLCLCCALLAGVQSSIASEGDPADVLAAGLEKTALRPDLGSLPVEEFIERVYSAALGLDVVLAPEVRALAEPVDLRLRGAVSREQLFRIGRSVLARRGVALSVDGKALVFTVSDPAGARLPPRLLGRERAEPGRDVFVQVPLTVVTPVKVGVWLTETLASSDFNVDEDSLGNSVLLSGPLPVVEEALRMVQVLDQPRALARHGARVVPRHADAESLAKDLVAILQSEGVAADERSPVSTVLVFPLSTQNAVVVFAARPGLLDHVLQWAEHIDRPGSARFESGFFSWPLEHRQAVTVVDALSPLLQSSAPPRAVAAGASPGPGPEMASGNASASPPDAATAELPTGREPRTSPPLRPALAADPVRNAVMFRGPAEEWRRLVPQIRAMDSPTPSVMVEVLVLDLRLGSRFSSGLDWLASRGIGGDDVSAGTRGLLPGDGGFNLLLRDGATVRAALELFAAEERVAIRARPRLLVESGHEARLEVGDEVPVLASSARTIARPDAPQVNTIEYRRTGISLAVRPTVLPGDRLEIDIAQDLSAARENESSGLDSPSIRSRHLQTTVSLGDGAAVLLGGLDAVSGSASIGGGLPLPAPVDALDARLREDERTELLIMVRPSVLHRPEDAAASP